MGAKAGSDDFDDIVKALQAIRESDEFNDLVRSLRAHAAHTLRELASVLDGTATSGTGPGNLTTKDLVDRVKDLVGRE